jgi:hypothetical protein
VEAVAAVAEVVVAEEVPEQEMRPRLLVLRT